VCSVFKLRDKRERIYLSFFFLSSFFLSFLWQRERGRERERENEREGDRERERESESVSVCVCKKMYNHTLSKNKSTSHSLPPPLTLHLFYDEVLEHMARLLFGLHKMTLHEMPLRKFISKKNLPPQFLLFFLFLSGLR